MKTVFHIYFDVDLHEHAKLVLTNVFCLHTMGYKPSCGLFVQGMLYILRTSGSGL
jgi:hypothetical protein